MNEHERALNRLAPKYGAPSPVICPACRQRVKSADECIAALVARLEEYGKMLDELIPLARSLWQMVDDSDIGHRALRPETKRLIDECAIRRASQLLPPKGAGDEVSTR